MVATTVMTMAEGEAAEDGAKRVRALNLAAVLRNIVVRGYYTRSTFMQSEKQHKSLPEFAEAMVTHPFLDDAKHTF